MQGAEPGFQKIPGETASAGNPAQERNAAQQNGAAERQQEDQQAAQRQIERLRQQSERQAQLIPEDEQHERVHQVDTERAAGSFRQYGCCARVCSGTLDVLQNCEQRGGRQNGQRSCTAGEPLNPEVFNRWKELTGLMPIDNNI